MSVLHLDSPSLTAPRSKSNSSVLEEKMYKPLAEAFNYALEHLAAVEVEGLPKFKSHIAFAPCDKGVKSDRPEPGSSFKPDIVVVTLDDAREMHQIPKSQAPNLSQLVGEIKGKPPSHPRWKSVLSAVEVKRADFAEWTWSGLGHFDAQEGQVGEITVSCDESLLEEKLDVTQIIACKIGVRSC